MAQVLPRIVKPRECAQRRTEFRGRVALSELPRVCAAVLGGDGGGDSPDEAWVEVSLVFAQNGADRPACEGEISARLLFECQRCLEPVELPVHASVRVEFVDGEDAEALAEAHEAVLMNDGAIVLRELLEDELLLAMPFAPVHAQDTCELHPDLVADEADAQQAADEQRVRPFEGLKELLTPKH